MIRARNYVADCSSLNSYSLQKFRAGSFASETRTNLYSVPVWYKRAAQCTGHRGAPRPLRAAHPGELVARSVGTGRDRASAEAVGSQRCDTAETFDATECHILEALREQFVVICRI